MFARREGLVLLAVCLAAVGCPQDIAADPRDDLSALLPPGLTLDTRSDDDGLTLGEKLRRLGAHAQEGKIVDDSGREVRIVERVFPGTRPDPKERQERQKREADELDRLRENYTAVLIVLRLP